MASLVEVSGSSYRGADARMLVFKDGSMQGALSGGCVEKEILRQSMAVFKNGTPVLMEYNGRYRLGCEGMLWILLEPFFPTRKVFTAFEKLLSERKELLIHSYYPGNIGSDPQAGSFLEIEGDLIPLRQNLQTTGKQGHLESRMPPKFRLLIFGGEHDTIALTESAIALGWEVFIINPATVEVNQESYPAGTHVIMAETGKIPVNVDAHTAIILMTHNYARDLHWLLALCDTKPAYLGLLGPAQRREKLLNDLLDHVADITPGFEHLVHGPAGLNLGAVTPQEIAVSVIAEILSFTRKKIAYPLREKQGRIHQ